LTKRMMIWLQVVVLGVWLSACGESSIEKVEGDDASSGDTQAEAEETENSAGEEGAEDAETEEPKTEEYKVGDTVNFDGLHITLTNVRVSEGGEFDEPQNDKFLLVELDIENTTDESAAISTIMNMKLMDADSYEQDQTILIDDVKGNLDAEISPGKKLKGEIPFDVVDSDYYEYIFEDPFASGQAIWKIEQSDIQQ
jgi:plastocyanin